MTLESAATKLLTTKPDMRQDQGRAFVAIYYMFRLADTEGRIGIEAFNKIKPDSVVRALRTAKEEHDTYYLDPKNNGKCPCPINCGSEWRTKKNKEDAERIRQEKSKYEPIDPHTEKTHKPQWPQENTKEVNDTIPQLQPQQGLNGQIDPNKGKLSMVQGYAEETGKSLEEAAKILNIKIGNVLV